MFLINTAMEKIPIGTAALIVVLGMAVVFFGLILLMFVTKIAGAIIGRKKAAAPAAAPAAAAPAAPAAKNAPAPGSAGKIALHDVPDKTAAMLMAIVADRTGKPLNQLRFISIREVKD
ncbi:MAG: OadG family protein [Oscillospiraceae bacterium]